MRYFQFDLRKRVFQKLQFVLNAAARQWKDLFVCPENMIKFRRFFKIDLYWLPVKELLNIQHVQVYDHGKYTLNIFTI